MFKVWWSVQPLLGVDCSGIFELRAWKNPGGFSVIDCESGFLFVLTAEISIKFYIVTADIVKMIACFSS